VWGLLSLELWHQMFHDRAAEYGRMLADMPDPAAVGVLAAEG
jgi:asparagine synthase (glutamine-hydrolysing)